MATLPPVFRLAGLLLSAVLLQAASAAAHAQAGIPQSSCAKPRSAVHQRICSSPFARLRQVDRDLQRWYERALANERTRPDQLQAEQQAWVQELGSCLKADPAEPARYVCDRVRRPLAHSQCQRDFCLVRRYTERARVLHHLATLGLPGRYVMSPRLPTGEGTATRPVADDDLPLCRAVAADLARLEPLARPLQAGGSGIATLGIPWTPVAWLTPDTRRQLSLATRLETALREHHGHPDGPVVRSEEVVLLAARLRSGDATVQVSVAPDELRRGTARRDEPIIVRYERWADTGRTGPQDLYDRVQYFSAAEPALLNFTILGTADDAFRHRGEVYLASVGRRGFDDLWRPLPLTEPVLRIHKLGPGDGTQARLLQACQFVYAGELENRPDPLN